MKKKYSIRLLLTAFCFMMLSTNLKAQIEDFKVGTSTRQMLVYAPSGIEPNCPLMISMHGMNQDINYQKNQAKWELVAKENNFVVVYPAGIGNSWDISGTRDTDFILAIIDEMSKRYGIDRERVYLSGFSMGGMFTYHAATKIADKIAAFAPVSGYLMGGPNTSSSRPIPIIHTHGIADDVVAFSGVQRCMDAWIARNKCPKTAQITQPYPADKASKNGTRYYWGPGTDSVEIVLLSIKSVGHWHSNDDNGIHTSKEIWNFCKKFSLGYGVPKFKYASVNNQNPKQLHVSFTLPIKESESYNGFTVKVDGETVSVDSIAADSSGCITINLTDSIKNSNEIQLSYTKGNVLSTYNKYLNGFNDMLVENLLDGATPRIVEISVNDSGNMLIARFNKKMLLPTEMPALNLTAHYNDSLTIPLTDYSFLNGDSTAFAFTLAEKMYADYNILLTYSGNSLFASDSSMVKNFSDYQVKNQSIGLPVNIVSGVLEDNAFTLALEFSKPMKMNDAQLGQFAVDVNGTVASVKEVFLLNNSIRLVLNNNLFYGDTIKVTYTPGNIAAADRGPLVAFNEFVVENKLQMPTWNPIPEKIEAEDFVLQFGISTETTKDAGGGLNVGWTETGDWMIYAIENNSDEEEFEIKFRLAAESAGSFFNYYIDNVKAGQVSVPATGGWQVFQSVIKKIVVPKGKHYFKITVVNSGFNINYFEIQKSFTGTKDLKIGDVIIYPEKSSGNIVIKSSDFKYNKIEIFDMLGKVVLSKEILFDPELLLPVNLVNGVYMIKVSNENQYQMKKVAVMNN